MFAIIQTGGKQYKISKGQVLEVDKIFEKEGSIVNLSNVLLLNQDNKTEIGRPLLEGAYITAKISSHKKGPKVVIYKMKAKKRYQKKKGFRKQLTKLEILEINNGKGKFTADVEERVQKTARPKTIPTQKAASRKISSRKKISNSQTSLIES